MRRRHWLWCLAAAVLFFQCALLQAQQPPQALSAHAAEALDLLESSDPYKQEVGFLRLEALREQASVPLILPYASHKDPELRAGAVRALAAIEGAEAVALLIDRIAHDPHPRVRRAAMLGIEPFLDSNPKILPLLIEKLRDRDATVRMTAIDVVSRSSDPAAREAILQRNKREGRRDVRRVLDLAMKRLGPR